MPDPTQEALRTWIQEILRRRKWTATYLANQAGLSHSTLNRFLNKTDYKGSLNAQTIAKLSTASRIPAPAGLGVAMPLDGGFAEQEVTPVQSDPLDDPNLSSWTVKNSLLQLKGFMPGDNILVDASLKAAAGDVVMAQIYDMKRGTAETVLRVYRPPYLVTASPTAHDQAPEFVDNERVVIVGVVTQRHWQRDISH